MRTNRSRLTAAMFFVILLLFLPPFAGAKDRIGKGETLDLKQCIEIALERHPNILAAGYTVKAGESRVGQAKSGRYPQVAGSAGYSRTDSVFTPTGAISNSYSSSVFLNQNLYDCGKTNTQVKIQEFSRDSSRFNLEDIRAQVIFGVKQAYWLFLQAGKNRDVAREVVTQFEHHLEQAKGFFEIGTKPKFDVTKAEVDLSGAKLNLLRAENALKLARVFLNNALGLPEAEEFEVVDQLSFQHPKIDLEGAIRRAYDRRPDLLSIAMRKKSLEETIELARKDYYPSVTGNASYTWGGADFPLRDGWSVGAQVNIPIFSGYLTKYQVEEARANVDALSASEAFLRQSIYQDVKQAWLNLDEAASRFVTAEISVRQALENLDLANGRYASGVGNPIEVTDALVAASNAKTAQISALYDYKVAQASLERATGE